MPVNGIIRLVAVACLATLAACDENELILEGPREPLRPQAEAAEKVNRVLPLTLPAQVSNPEWDHKGGAQTHAVPNPALRQPLSAVWSTDIGSGNNRSLRLAADPIVSGGRIFTLDAKSRLSAVGLGGDVLWMRDLTPEGERAGDASGGGLAADGGILYATTGFGRIVALDPATGDLRWEQRLGAAAGGAPMVANGVVYLTSRNATGWALDARTGRILWQVLATPAIGALVGGPSPALAGDLVVFPFASGQLVAVNRTTGDRTWIASIAGNRPERAFSRVRDVTGDPVVVGGRIYAGTHGGRTSAINATTGQTLWTANEGAMSPVWVAGGSVFLISDENRLVRLEADSGEIVWSVDLPFYTKEKQSRRKTIFAHYGPVLAGGRLIVLSDDEVIRNFDPASGALISVDELPAGAARNPVVAGGVLYVVTEDGRLHAFR